MSTDISQPLQTAMREAGFVDPRSGNPSLNQWSKASGVHTSTISRFVSGGTTRPDRVKEMADALGVSLKDLYSMTGRSGDAPWAPPAGTEKLTVRQRQALTELILSFIDEGKAGDGRGEATPLTDAGGTPATGAADGYGTFGGRARGDLDHESQNDGAGGNVHELFTPPPPASETAAWETENRGRKAREQQDEDAEGSQESEDDDE